jgi:hypothetical protein
MHFRRVSLVVLSLCLALVVQGVAQARVIAIACGAGQTSHMTSHGPSHAMHRMPGGAAAAQVGHDCCDDADGPPAQGQPCKMGSSCHPVSLLPLLAAPVGARVAAAPRTPIVFVVPALPAGISSRVWRPPTLA